MKENVESLSEVPVGGIFRFKGFDGEIFIKSAEFKGLIRADYDDLLIADSNKETARYFSLSTGMQLSETDADIIDLPITVYDAKLEIEA